MTVFTNQFTDLFRAEWQKIVGNRWASGFLLWIFPVGLLAFLFIQFILLIVFDLGVEVTSADLASTTWTEQMLGIWRIPSNALGRILVVSFITVFIAGEYQWGTWKSIVPRSARGRLLFAKFFALMAAFLLAFNLSALIQGFGMSTLASFLNVDFGPELSGPVFRDFMRDYFIQMGLAAVTILISAGYATIAGMITRSILGGVLISVGFTIVEPISFIGLFVLSQFLDASWIYWLGRFTPFYNIENVTSWLFMEMPTELGTQIGLGAEYNFSDPLSFSLLVLTVWAVGLTMLMLFIFRRQDITS